MNHYNATAPEGVLIFENYLDTETMTVLKQFADGQIGVINKIELAQEDGRLAMQKFEGFSSDCIYLGNLQETALGICADIFGKVIPEHYGAKIEFYEYPHIIRYRKGGQYVPHADADSWDTDAGRWRRNVDRDYSAILYFNDGFEGGGLYFPDHDFRIQPKPGLLVCFPSDSRFVHTAEPVTQGNRYAFVTWAAARNGPRLFDEPRGHVVYLRDQAARAPD